MLVWLLRVCKTYNLRKIERVVADGVEYEILKPIDDRQKLLSQRRHARGVVEALEKSKIMLCQTQFARAGRSQACVAPLPSPVLFAVSECVEVVACVHEVVLGETKVLGGLSDGRGG